MTQQRRIHEIRKQGSARAVVFIHGFTGDQDETWGSFPLLLGSEVSGWDIFTFGYPTTLLPDIAGIWSADPDLETLAGNLSTVMGLSPLRDYREVALVAHSMGGLILQRALLDDEALSKRATHVVLFGTPSGGLKKARWIAFWKRQLKNMSIGSPFITSLREGWDERYIPEASFRFLAVAGTKDEFVPRTSSLDPFPVPARRVVDGNHVTMVKPEPGTASLRLLVDALTLDGAEDVADVAPVPGPPPVPEQPTEKEVVKSALALDHADRRADSMALLEKHEALGTDVMGTLAGRHKRVWLETEATADALEAYKLYTDALAIAREKKDSEQVYYHAINAAFLELVAFGKPDAAKTFAEEALQHAGRSPRSIWSLATQAEANLYLGNLDDALAQYREVVEGKRAEPWQLASTGLQAAHVAAALENERVRDEIDALLSPGARKVFVSYSHRDAAWLGKLKTLLKPYLEDAHIEFWDDSQISTGSQWKEAITRALDAAGVAVALASSNFLASEFVASEELPRIIEGAKADRIRLVWVALDPAGYEVSPLYEFQCVNDPHKPLTGLGEHEQQTVLLDAARKIKEAALGHGRG